MTNRVAAAAFALLLLSACHPARIGQGRNASDRAVTVAGRLVCPDRVGDLSRTDAAADGRNCRYAADDRRVELSYLPLARAGADATVALKRVENDLRSRLAPAAPVIGAAEGARGRNPTNEDDKDDDADEPAKTSAGDGDGGNVSINLPGLHVETRDGDAHVRVLGETIDADERGGAVVSGRWNDAGNEIHAGHDGVEMRFGFVGRQAVDMKFILTSKTSGPSGAKLVGYVARGPVTGPLVLAIVTATDERDNGEHADFKDVENLVADNVSR